ncbi:MAG: glycoside hydrolase family 2 TIM barrel-domain containing protein [Actinomycetota bacterium]
MMKTLKNITNLALVIFVLALPLTQAAVISKTAGKVETQIHYLSGTGKDDTVLWDFFCTAGRKSGAWTKIAVPSNWEQQGFGAYNYGRDKISETNPLATEQGKYRYKFNVPSDWKEKTVRLVFDGSMTDTEVWINGKSAGEIHQGSFYRFKYDITPLLKFGESNLLEVTVSKVSANESVNNAERFNVDYWVFGGIFRPVFLEALPKQFIDRTAIDARADGSFSADVYLGENISTDVQITAQILDASGTKVGAPFSAKLSPNQNTIKLQTIITSPKLWTAETPNLYRVQFTLSESSKPLHTVTERFGFRTFELRIGDGLYLNGQKIILKGTNRHSFHPESARTLSRQISDTDVRLIKEMNMNAVRMSHYPPDAHFLEACDELGLYVLDELAGWHRSYDTPTGARLIGEMIRRDVNHPSILFWDNGNEGGWNKANDAEFAKWDPQRRIVLHPWELFNQINTGHYKKFDVSTQALNGKDIYMPTEMLHGLYDGGAGAGLWDFWELMRGSRVGAGGFIWALVDESVARTDQNNRLDSAGNQAPDGIVGPYREKEGSFYTIKEIWSPVQVAPQKLPEDFQGILKVENRYDFTNLSDCKFEWNLARFPVPDENKSGHKITDSGIVKSPNIEPHKTGELKLNLPKNWRQSEVLYLTVKDSAGHELWTWSWDLKNAAKAEKTVVKTKKEKVLTSEETSGQSKLLVVKVGATELLFDKDSGYLFEVRRNGKSIGFGDGPKLLAFRRNDRNYDDLSVQSELTKFTSRTEGEDVVVVADYKSALRHALWRISPDGTIKLDYEYSFDGTVDMLGIGFSYPEEKMKGIRWLGWGPYRVWQNRLQGTRLDVWENKYNDSTPGESWFYPEFKGYFRDWKWASFETTDGKITVKTEADNLYLGVYKPKDGKEGLLNFPQTGITFLDVIPAMRNKFHTTDEIGPQSKPRQVTGLKRRTIQFQFSDEETQGK